MLHGSWRFRLVFASAFDALMGIFLFRSLLQQQMWPVSCDQTELSSPHPPPCSHQLEGFSSRVPQINKPPPVSCFITTMELYWHLLARGEAASLINAEGKLPRCLDTSFKKKKKMSCCQNCATVFDSNTAKCTCFKQNVRMNKYLYWGKIWTD